MHPILLEYLVEARLADLRRPQRTAKTRRGHGPSLPSFLAEHLFRRRSRMAYATGCAAGC